MLKPIKQQQHACYRLETDDIKPLPISVIKHLNLYHNNDIFKHLPESTISIISNFSDALYGDINEFETKYKAVRLQLKSMIHSATIEKGSDVFFELYDGGDDESLYEFLKLRLKRRRDYNSAFNYLQYNDTRSKEFKALFVNYHRTIQEIILMFYNSIQDYFDFKTMFSNETKVIYTNNDYDFFRTDNSDTACFAYTTKYDDSDDEPDNDFVENIINQRLHFFKAYNKKCWFNGSLSNYYKTTPRDVMRL